MPKCVTCGTENTAQAKFCKECGTTLNPTSTNLSAADLIAKLQRAKEEAEGKVPQLQAELEAKGRELAAALEKGAALERDLASATSAPGPVAAAPLPTSDAVQNLQIEKDRLAAALAAAGTRIKDLEQGLGGNIGKLKAIAARSRWLTPTLSAALAVVTGFVGFDFWRDRTPQTESTAEVQVLRDSLETARQTEARLQDEISTLRKSPPPPAGVDPKVGVDPKAGADPKAAATLAARETAARQSEEANARRGADLDAQAVKLKEFEQHVTAESRRLADERKAIDTARKEMKSAPRVTANPAAAFGFLLWQGRVQASTDIFITGSQVAGGGEVSGTLPGRKCDVRDEKIGARVKIVPGPNNNWNQAVISPEPGRVATVLFVWTCQGR